ncbi:MAG: APC family permease [Planctomycetaceae bacterium]|nr:APC family permease [Planctomycetaceae bacterium]
MADPPKTSPPTSFGLVSLTSLVVASMVGTGVFTTSGYTLAAVGTPGRVLLCWMAAGVIACCGAVAYGRLAALIPQSGGEYLYLSRNVHPMAGFLAGWTSLVAGFSGAIATAAVAFESYAVPETVRPEWLPQDAVAVLLVVLCGLLHARSAYHGSLFQNVVVFVKLLTLGVFVIIVLTKLPTHQWHWTQTDNTPETTRDVISAMAVSLVWISLSYAGFNAAIYVASESADAAALIPKSLLIGTVGVTCGYIVLNAVFVTSVPASQMASQDAVAAIAAGAVGGRRLEFLIRLAVSLGLLTSVSAMIMAGPRVYSQMADDGVFPEVFGSRAGGIPKSVLLQTVIAAGLILIQRVLVEIGWITSSLLGLLSYLGTTLSVSSAACVATLYLPNVRRRMLRSVVVDIAAGFYVTATLGSVVIMILTHNVGGHGQGMKHVAGAIVTLVTGILVWPFMLGRPNRQRESDKS